MCGRKKESPGDRPPREPPLAVQSLCGLCISRPSRIRVTRGAEGTETASFLFPFIHTDTWCRKGPQGGLSEEPHSSSPSPGKARTGAKVNRRAGRAEGPFGSAPPPQSPGASIQDSPAVSAAVTKLCGRKKESPGGRLPREPWLPAQRPCGLYLSPVTRARD